MPHPMGYCDCGRAIHFPASARYYDRLRCFNCGRILTLTPGPGMKPTYVVPSARRPRRQPKPRVVIVQVQQPPLGVNPFIPQPDGQLPPPPPTPQLASPRRGGLLAWLFGE
jgi:hypothetical protein